MEYDLKTLKRLNKFKIRRAIQPYTTNNKLVINKWKNLEGSVEIDDKDLKLLIDGYEILNEFAGGAQIGANEINEYIVEDNIQVDNNYPFIKKDDKMLIDIVIDNVNKK